MMKQTEFTNIAIVKLSAIGDVVHALPVASALRERYPKARLSWIVQGKCQQILEGNPDLDDIIVFDKDRWLLELPYVHKTASVLREIYRFGRSLRRAGFELAIDLQGLIKSGLITWLTGARVRIGFSADCCREPASARFTNWHVTPSASDVHIVDRYLSLIRELGADVEHRRFKIHIPAEDHAYIARFLDRNKISDGCRLVVINPGAGWETKLWGEENYAALADRIISDLGGVVIFLWGPPELPMVKAIQKKMHQPSIRACPTNLKQSLALMRRARLFIAGDTGPLHMAAALGIPCLGLYGPTSPERNGPYGANHRVVQAEGVPCRGCFRRFCTQKTCMRAISVDQVMEAARQMLTETH